MAPPLATRRQLFLLTLSSALASVHGAAEVEHGPAKRVKVAMGPNYLHGSPRLHRTVLISHAVVAAVTVVVLFPSVAIVLRLISSRHIIRLHWILQLCNLVVLLTAFGLGVWLSWLQGQLWLFPHQILGTIIVLLFLIQPVFGYLQHRSFRRTGVRSFYSPLHVWYGRVLMVLGIVNGGVGLYLAADSTLGQKGIYIAGALVMSLAYVASQIWWFFKMKSKVLNRAQEKGCRLDERLV